MQLIYVYHMLVPQSRSDAVTGEQSVAGDERLMNCSESKIGLSLPSPLSERLDQLVRLAEGVGERTTRKEVVASLILERADGWAGPIRKNPAAPFSRRPRSHRSR